MAEQKNGEHSTELLRHRISTLTGASREFKRNFQCPFPGILFGPWPTSLR
jgi:hypothetical protein